MKVQDLNPQPQQQGNRQCITNVAEDLPLYHCSPPTCTLLSLIPPSCMVAPNRDLENIHFLSSAFTTSTAQMHPLPSAMEIDINNVNNYDNIRGRSHSLSNISSRSVFVILKASSRPYHEKMVINNNLFNKEFVEPVGSFQLSYNSDGQERNCVSIVTDPFSLKGPNMF